MIREWMLYGTVIGACCAALAWAIDSWLRATGRARRWVWIVAMLASVAVPALVAVRPRVTIAPDPAWNPAVNEVRRLPAVGVTAPQRPIAGPLWAGGSALLLLCIVGGLVQLRRIRRRASHETWESTRVAVTDHVGPGAGPFGEPRIFVPAWMRALPGEQVSLLLHHEREHVAAGDARLLLGGAVMLCVAPWNLALWWCYARLRTAIECDCDARVLKGKAGVGLGEYARLLLDLARPMPRVAPLPALLPLAGSAHQLRTRIEAMTASYRLSPSRGLGTIVLAAAAVVAACEVRRPDPVAPVTDYIVREGQAAPVRITASNADSVRKALGAKVKGSLEPVTIVGVNPVVPVVVVKDATGGVLYSARLEGDVNAVLSRVSSSTIASIEVIKNRGVLAEGAEGGLIVVQLKAGATWPGASADSAAGISHGMPEGPRRAVRAPGMSLRSPEPSSGRGGSAARTEVRIRQSPGEPLVLPRDSTSPERQEDTPIVELVDASNRDLWSGKANFGVRDAEGSTIGPYLVRYSDIDRVEVRKNTVAAGIITIYLKAGVTPARR